MPTKKPSPQKAVARAPKATAKAAPTKKPVAKKAEKKPAPKPAKVKAAPTPKSAVKPVPAAKPVAAKSAPPKAGPAKPASKPAKKAEAKKPAPKAEAPAKAKKVAKAEAAPAPAPAAREAPVKAPKAAKAVKPLKANGAATAMETAPVKSSKREKIAPVAAALAKPAPIKPLAVAAGRAQPVTMAPLTTPVRQPPRPLAAPKPVVAAEPETVGDSKPVPAFKGKTNAAKGMVLVGAVSGAFGVKGEVRLRAFTEAKDGVIAYGPLCDETGKVILKPKTWRELKDGVAVSAPEVKTREQAEALRGTRLFVPRANLPNLPAEADEYYWVDLMGCRAETVDGAPMGEVVAVWNFGAGDILELKPPSGGPNTRIIFNRETVPLVDPSAKRIVVDPPAPEPMEK